MQTESEPRRRRRAVLRIFREEDWGNLELLDEWDGENLDELKTLLDEEEFQKLLDRLQEDQDRR